KNRKITFVKWRTIVRRLPRVYAINVPHAKPAFQGSVCIPRLQAAFKIGHSCSPAVALTTRLTFYLFTFQPLKTGIIPMCLLSNSQWRNFMFEENHMAFLFDSFEGWKSYSEGEKKSLVEVVLEY